MSEAPEVPPEHAQKDRDQRKLLVGASYNFLGSLGRIIIPLYYILANRIYGTDAYGLYALAIAPTEILTSFVGAGFADAIQRFSARDADRHEATSVHYAVLWRCTWWVVLASVVAAIAVIFGGHWLATSRWHRPDAYWTLVLFAINAPLVGVMGILLSACRAVLDMKGDVLVRGFVAPILLIVFAMIYRPFFPNVYGMCLALTTSNLVGVAAAIWYFRKHYSLRKLLAGRHTPAPRGLLAFAIPQSINMTIWQGLWNVDIMMLAGYVSNERIALYRIAAEIGRTVYGIRYSFSNVYAPLVARYTLENDIAGLQESYTRLSRWISIVAVPVVAIIVLSQAQLLWIVNPSFDGGAAFLWLLMIGPLLACSTGLSGNILVMTGHHFWNLSNSALLLASLAGLNLVLIPRYGMVGASVATMVAISGMSLLQIVEVRWLNGIRVEVSRLWKPFVAGTVAFLVAYAAGQAVAQLAPPRLVLALVKTFVLLAVYAGGLLLLRLDVDDAAIVAKWRARRA